jgi:hypothetical protein
MTRENLLYVNSSFFEMTIFLETRSQRIIPRDPASRKKNIQDTSDNIDIVYYDPDIDGIQGDYYQKTGEVTDIFHMFCHYYMILKS